MQWKVGPNYKERPYKILGELVELGEGTMIEGSLCGSYLVSTIPNSPG